MLGKLSDSCLFDKKRGSISLKKPNNIPRTNMKARIGKARADSKNNPLIVKIFAILIIL